MNRRERALRAVELRRPDRCPIVHSILPAAFLTHGKALVDLLSKYPNDFGSSEHSIPKIEDLSPDYKAGRNADSWGTVWESTTNGIHGQVADYPIHTWEQAEEYQFPPLPGDEDIAKRRTSVAEAKKDLLVMNGFNPGNYFERLQWLLGFRTVLTCLVRQPPQFVRFADRLLEYCLQSIGRTDLDDFAERTRGRFCINSDVDRQGVLPHASAREMASHIRYLVRIFGQDNEGGLFGRGELNMDVPLDNVKAMFDSFVRYGKYKWR